MKFTNLLNISGWVFILLAILFYIPTWGGSLLLLIVALIFGVANLLTRNNSKKSKAYVGVGIYCIFILIALFFTRTITLQVNGAPKQVYILTNVEGEPPIHSIMLWKKNVSVPDNFILRTSSTGSQLDNINFDIRDNFGKQIGHRGITTYYGQCTTGAALITLQTIYFEMNSWPDSVQQVNASKLQAEQQINCENVR